MNCGYGEKIILYAYGEASADIKAGVEAHLKTCADCRGELAVLASAQGWLKAEAQGPSAAIVSAVLKQAAVVDSPGWWGNWREVVLAGAFASVAAAGFSLSALAGSPGLAWNSGLDAGLDSVEYALYQEQSEVMAAQSDWDYSCDVLEAESQQALG